jgi:hypothetical protein
MLTGLKLKGARGQMKRQGHASNNAQTLAELKPGEGFKTSGLHLMQGLAAKG